MKYTPEFPAGEHPYDEKRREDARILREHARRCTNPECCTEEDKIAMGYRRE